MELLKLKCSPDVDNIKEIKQILDYFLDKEFLDKQSSIIKLARGKNQLANILPVSVHPGFDFLNFVNKLIKTNPPSLHPLLAYRSRDLMQFSLAAKTILKMCDGNLENFKSKKFYNDFRGRFRDTDGYHHLIYEMCFANFLEFHFKDVGLEIYNESGVRWPDIKAVKENKTMRIECKSLDARKGISNKICYQMMEILHKSKKNFDIVLKFQKTSNKRINHSTFD